MIVWVFSPRLLTLTESLQHSGIIQPDHARCTTAIYSLVFFSRSFTWWFRNGTDLCVRVCVCVSWSALTKWMGETSSFFCAMQWSFFLWMTDNFLSDPQYCEFYFLKCSVCCIPLKSAGLCSACSYLHMSLILSRSAPFFFFPKNLSLLIELNINLDLLTYRKIGSLGIRLYLDYSYMLMYRDLLGCRVFHRKNETGKDIL